MYEIRKLCKKIIHLLFPMNYFRGIFFIEFKKTKTRALLTEFF